MTIKQLKGKIIYIYGDTIRYLDTNDINCIVQKIVIKKKKNEYKGCKNQ